MVLTAWKKPASPPMGLYMGNEPKETRQRSIGNKMKSAAATIVVLSMVGLALDFKNSFSTLRRMSVDNGDGTCTWTGSTPVDLNLGPYGTLLASYPGAGMRLTWQMTEASSGIDVGDDFFYSGKLGGIVKTQYPHPEGIWSYGANMDQTILLTRNPRWNIPSYHTLLYELEYAHDYVVAYDNVFTAFSRRAPMENWLKWRDYRFEDEINLWGWQIDFYMEDGPQFWQLLDLERAGQYPFRYWTESERPWMQDDHCANDIPSCKPKAVVSYENLKDPEKGPDELRKIANEIRGKRAMDTMLSDEIMDCIYAATLVDAPEPRNENRDAAGVPASEYKFSINQMKKIQAKLIFLKNKYSTVYEYPTGSGIPTGTIDWVQDKVGRELTKILHGYIEEVTGELGDMLRNPPPTQAPSVGSQKALVDWFNTIGRGNRHAKDIVQHMATYWGLVEDLYDQDPTPAPTPCPSDFTGYNLNEEEQEWLDEHNTRRTAFYEMNGMTPKNLTWSRDLQARAQTYAETLANYSMPTNVSGCFLPPRLGGDRYGTQNTAMNRGDILATPSQVLAAWHDAETNFTAFPEMHLKGPRFHATQVLFRSSKYVGCGQASKTNPSNGETCHFHVCRYIAPGNCFLEAFTDVYPSFKTLFQEEDCMDNHHENYWVCSTLSDHASSICQDPPELPMTVKDACIAVAEAREAELEGNTRP